MSEKVLTVIVPSYNMEKYLPKCLGSLVVMPKLMERLEVLVINDGSTDRTSEIAHEFATKWPGTFKVVDKDNGNYGSCINAGLMLAKGQYVRVLDADDWYENSEFVNYIGFLCRVNDGLTEAVDLILSDFEFVDLQGKSFRHMSYAFVDYPKFSIGQFNNSENTRLWMHAVAYRSEFLRKIDYRQTEGLSYTDQEWASVPMAYVRTIKRYRGSVYRYLNGRDGQTCYGDTYSENLWQQMIITQGLARRYGQVQSQLHPENRQFLINHLTQRIRLIYSVYFGCQKRIRGSEELKGLDLAVRDALPDLYAELDGMRLSRHLGLYCVREWRKSGSDRTWKFQAYWTFRRVCDFLRRRMHNG